MIWKLSTTPAKEKIDLLVEQLSVRKAVSPILASIFIQRGIDTFDKAQEFFVPSKAKLYDPYLMKGMQKAVDRLIRLKEEGEHLVLLGDYDVDGTTSVAMMGLFLTNWGISWDYYIPDRYDEGYGISYKGIEFAGSVGASVVISLDCGIKAIDKVKLANHRGLDVIICDHHKAGTTLPAAYAILDPQQEDCPYPFKELSGCGVAFKLISALHKVFLDQAGISPVSVEDPLDAYADLLALSIACDIVPLKNENRILAHYGLQKLRSHPLPGIHSIMSLSDRERSWDISDLIFFVGPQINSAGRLMHAKEAVEILLGRAKPEQVKDLYRTNDHRKVIDRQMTLEALDMISEDNRFEDKSSTTLFQASWHKGVIGIVASRLIEHHYRPTILFTKSEENQFWVGSARSVKGFNLYSALEACKELLLRFGGHRYAAGLTIKEENLPLFCNKFDKIVAETILPEQKKPVLSIDHLIRFPEINFSFIMTLNRMAPFGPANQKPVFVTTEVEIIDASILKGNHLKVRLKQDGVCLDAIGFNMADTFLSLTTTRIAVAFQLSIDTWNEQKKIKLRLKDIKPLYELEGIFV